MTDFRVAVSGDFLNTRGELAFGDIGLGALDDAGIAYDFHDDAPPELTPAHLRGYDALLLMQPAVGAKALVGADRLKLVARFGVGYDNVDVEACTEHGVIVTITPDGTKRPTAVSTLACLLAVTHKLLAKDRLTRTGGWHQKLDHLGVGLTGRTLGVVGFGRIGREVLRLVQPFGMDHLVADHHASAAEVAALGARLVSLDNLLDCADFVTLHCRLDATTHHLINADKLARMKPDAILVNQARGAVVDQRALVEALRAGHLGGAALDVFEQEPVHPDDPLLTLDNVLLTPHAACWTDELFRGNGASACRSILDVAAGRVPEPTVNPAVRGRSALREKLGDVAERRAP